MNKQQITLVVSKDHQYYLDNADEHHPTPADQLEDVLKARVAGLDQPTILLKLDKSLTVQDLVDVLQIGSDLNIKMILATHPNNSN